MKKTLILTALLIVQLFLIPQVTHAATVEGMCSFQEGPTSYDTPPLTGIVCTGIRILNVGFLLIGGVFVIMFLFGMYKYATAWGDPKGIQGAQQTVTSAIIGVIVSFGTITIIVVFGNVLGLKANYIGGINPFDKLLTNICGLFEVADYTPTGCN